MNELLSMVIEHASLEERIAKKCDKWNFTEEVMRLYKEFPNSMIRPTQFIYNQCKLRRMDMSLASAKSIANIILKQKNLR